jgi:ElaB/YqjD/DUF883 family membrane-anchored ribosome-binding protein
MNTTVTAKPTTTTEGSMLADRAAASAHNAIHSTQTAANAMLDRLDGQVDSAHDRAVPLLNRLTSQAETTARRGVEAMRDTSTQIRERALKASDSTAGYIKDEPLKAMLIAAAAGAALMALLGLIGRSRSTD